MLWIIGLLVLFALGGSHSHCDALYGDPDVPCGDPDVPCGDPR